MKRNEERKQTFLYRRREQQFRICSKSLRKMERETGKRADEIIFGSSEGFRTILYYCTMWKGETVTLDEFLRDFRLGAVSFRPGRREFSIVGLRRLFMNRILEFKKRGEL